MGRGSRIVVLGVGACALALAATGCSSGGSGGSAAASREAQSAAPAAASAAPAAASAAPAAADATAAATSAAAEPAAPAASPSPPAEPAPSESPVTMGFYWNLFDFEVQNNSTFPVSMTADVDNYDWDHGRPDALYPRGLSGKVLQPGEKIRVQFDPNQWARSWPFVLHMSSNGKEFWSGRFIHWTCKEPGEYGSLVPCGWGPADFNWRPQIKGNPHPQWAGIEIQRHNGTEKARPSNILKVTGIW